MDQRLLVRDVMQRDIATVSPSCSVRDLRRLLARHRVVGMPVVLRGEILGVVSWAEIGGAADGRPGDGGSAGDFYDALMPGDPNPGRAADADEERLRVRDIMSRRVLRVNSGQPVRDAARTLLEDGARRVLVTNRGALAGIVTIHDLVRATRRAA